MWVALSLVSAFLLGFYDVFKKKSLSGNAVIPVLLINCAICSMIFLPMIVLSAVGVTPEASQFYVPVEGWAVNRFIILKSAIVLSSWICGYFAIKHLPVTIVGPVNATRPVMVLVGAMLLFGERLNLLQWGGVLIAILSFYLLGKSGKKEGIDFRSNHWVWLLVAAAVTGAASGLYDKFLMGPADAARPGLGLNRLFVQGWYNLYQTLMMGLILLIFQLPERGREGYTPLSWRWTIPLISVCLSAADMAYLYALSDPGAMISVVSMIRRGSVLISFIFGALIFREKNLRGKAFDLLLVLISLVLLLLVSLKG